MNRYYNPTSSTIFSESQIKGSYTNTCFSVPFTPPAGWFQLHEPVSTPVFDPIRQRLVDQIPVYEGGVYFAVLTVDTYPTLVQEARLAAEVRRLEQKVDADVDAIYQRVIGNRTVEYQLAYEEAKSWADSGYAGDPPFSVAAHVSAYGITAQASAAEILAVGNAWYGLVRTLRQERLYVKGLARTYQFSVAESHWNETLSSVAASF